MAATHQSVLRLKPSVFECIVHLCYAVLQFKMHFMCNISSILPRVRGSTCGFRRVLERSLQGGVCPIDALY